MSNLTAGNTVNALCFLSCIFITCAVLVKPNFSTGKRLIKLPQVGLKQPLSASMSLGLNPFACRTSFCGSTLQFFHPYAHGKQTFWTWGRNRARHHSLVHIMIILWWQVTSSRAKGQSSAMLRTTSWDTAVSCVFKHFCQV